jgi:hypothetical protein
MKFAWTYCITLSRSCLVKCLGHLHDSIQWFGGLADKPDEAIERVYKNWRDCNKGFVASETLKSNKSPSWELGDGEDITPLFLQLRSLNNPRGQSITPTQSARGKQRRGKQRKRRARRSKGGIRPWWWSMIMTRRFFACCQHFRSYWAEFGTFSPFEIVLYMPTQYYYSVINTPPGSYS